MIERYIPKHLGYLQAGDQGMHMVLWLAEYMDDRKIAQVVLDAGVAIKAVSPTFSLERKRSGLVLGLGDFELIQIERAVQSLAHVLKQHEQPLQAE
jgi:GntR family transcriptional regulator/MocR family aminotransferase